MSKHASFVVVCSLLIGGTTYAGYIHQQNQFYNEPLGYWYSIQPNSVVMIHHAVQGQVFQFDVTYDGQDTDINLITADENAGPVTIEVLPFHGQNYGADNVMEIRLGNIAGVTGVIQGLSVMFNVGDLGPVTATRIENDFKCEYGHITNDVTVGSLWGTLDAHSMQNVRVTDATAPPPGSGLPRPRIINRGASYAYTVYVAGDLEYLELYGALAEGGLIDVDGDALGIVLGATSSYGNIDVEQDLYEFTCWGAWGGDLRIGHDWLLGHYINNPSSDGTITVENDYRATVISAGTWYTPIVVGTPERIVGNWYGSLSTPRNWSIFAPITIGGHMFPSGSIISGWYLPAHADISVGGNMEGEIQVWRDEYPPPGPGHVLSDITVVGDLKGRILAQGDLTGNIVVGANMTGEAAYIQVENLNSTGLDRGHIIVNGMFGAAVNCTVEILGQIIGPAFVCFNYDAPPPPDSWPVYPPSAVRVGANSYYETEPSLHIWGISNCRGDMDNNHALDFNDINPLVQAIGDPDGYDLAYPGLGGSRVWHCDCNCDFSCNFDDINAFVELIPPD